MRHATATVVEVRENPFKGAQGFVAPSLTFDLRGTRYGRLWMAVDGQTNQFVAQRSERGRGVAIPEISQIRAVVEGHSLVLTAPDMPALRLQLDEEPAGVAKHPPITVKIWDSQVSAFDQGPRATRWINLYLRRYRPVANARSEWSAEYRLVRLSDTAERFTPDGMGFTTLTDAWPALVATTASLDELNRRIAVTQTNLDEPPTGFLGWDRIRPTLVLQFNGADARIPNLEDKIRWMQAGEVQFTSGTLCKRCLVTTTNQDTSVRGPEPLRTLSQYRRNPDTKAGGVVFGLYMRHTTKGTVQPGDHVDVMLAD